MQNCRVLLAVCVILFFGGVLSLSKAEGEVPLSERIEHVVVLMLENRAFDHMLGLLHKINPNIDGLTGNETNPFNPTVPNSGSARISPTAPDVTPDDPDHGVPGTRRQIYGFAKNETDPNMSGFVYDYYICGDTAARGANIMRVFNQTSLPVLSKLALEYAVFDRWYSSVPGPTQPNRMFFHSATSYGATIDDRENLALGYPQRTLFDNIWDSGLSWRDYWSDFPTILFLWNLRDPEYVFNYREMSSFYDDAASGDLPSYSFLEPRWFNFWSWNASDQHPPHSVQEGEFLLASIYNAVRNGPKWNKTLFIITYDEHGGFYDHVTPPQHNIPAPDDHKPPKDNDPFNFTRLGVRVPMIMVSPWIEKGSVVHEPKTAHYDHTSFAATLKKVWGLQGGFLTKRDAWAATFEEVLMQRNVARSEEECIKEIIVRDDKVEDWRRWEVSEKMSEQEKQMMEGKTGVRRDEVLSGLQRDVIAVARGVLGEERKIEEELKTEQEGAEYCLAAMRKWRSNTMSKTKLVQK
eukprot:TRINITY_DN536_c0_g1_i1.p1 TRINITY_DN536_c0_g1~~TRINITY_DN536_c0_g1_i1.p1  ORF type:complete len:540 (+),score=150.31 TRINITY_DN536_c0_g1_i1:60-1622(+)